MMQQTLIAPNTCRHYSKHFTNNNFLNNSYEVGLVTSYLKIKKMKVKSVIYIYGPSIDLV